MDVLILNCIEFNVGMTYIIKSIFAMYQMYNLRTMYNVHCILYCVHCTVSHNVYCILYYAHNVHCSALYDVQYLQYII